jgi:hypothetical protein
VGQPQVITIQTGESESHGGGRQGQAHLGGAAPADPLLSPIFADLTGLPPLAAGRPSEAVC